MLSFNLCEGKSWWGNEEMGKAENQGHGREEEDGGLRGAGAPQELSSWGAQCHVLTESNPGSFSPVCPHVSPPGWLGDEDSIPLLFLAHGQPLLHVPPGSFPAPTGSKPGGHGHHR